MAESDFIVKGNIVVNGVTIESDGTQLVLPGNTIVGNQLITQAIAGGFSVAADDSTQRFVNLNETIKFSGTSGITTSSNEEGDITISGPILSTVATSGSFADLTNKPTTLNGYGITDAATSAQGLLADTALQPGNNVSVLTNDAGYTTNTGTVTSVAASAGAGISVSGSPITASGTLTITNTAPDQTVTLTGSGATSISGTYPNFTVSSTDTNTTYTAGTGLLLVGTTFSNTAPDRTVVLASGTGISTSGTYPNFTVTNTAPHIPTNLGYSTATTAGTVTSSTGNNVTLPAATTSFAGLLTGADKTKLNGIETGAQVNVATNLGYTTTATTGTVTSSTGINATLPAATTTLAGLLTGADKTKLDGIAAGATANTGTVTSVAASAGAGISIGGSPVTTAGTLTITNTAPDQTVGLTQGGNVTITGTYPNFTIASADQFIEKVGTITSSNLNLATGNVFLSQPSANTTYTFSNPPASGTAYGFTLRVNPSATIAVTWPASVKWPDGIAPFAPASGATSVYVFYTQDAGATYFGFVAGESIA